MINALKWTTFAWFGVLVAGGVCFMMAWQTATQPVAWVLFSALIPLIFPPALLVLVVVPGTAPFWQLAVVTALALYFWLFGLVCFGLAMKAWNEDWRARPTKIAL